MRARLLTAFLVLIAATLLLASAGSYVLIRRDALQSVQRQLSAQVATIAAHPSSLLLRHQTRLARLRPAACCLNLLRVLGGYSTLAVVPLGAGSLAPDRGVLPAAQLRALGQGRSVSGHLGEQVYVVAPLTLTAAQQALILPAAPPGAQAVVVATRDVTAPAGGFGYFVLVAAVVMAVAAVVAYWLADRFSRPLRHAVEVTGRIARADWQARMDGHGEMPEFQALGSAINAMADRLDEARRQQRQFLLSVSHDLRTPLTSIHGYTEALQEGVVADVPAALNVIAAETGRLERLVQDLLDLARLDAHRFSFQRSSVDVASVVAETLEGFGAPGEPGVELSSDLVAGDPLTVSTDADRVHQLVANLVENALGFARSRVEVGARREPGGVVVWVADDGPGIAPEDLDLVFEPHFTSDSRAPGRRGTGLGLAIVAELAAAMGGRARAESPLGPDGGTKMTVHLRPLPG